MSERRLRAVESLALDSSKHYHHIKHDYTDHGIAVDGVRMDIEKMIERKRKIVKTAQTVA